MLNLPNVKIANLYLNNGSGVFTTSTSTFGGVTGDFDYGDFDGDNDLDIIVVGSNNLSTKTITMYENDGAGNFSNLGHLNLLQLYKGSVDFADIDNDNDLDLFIAGYESLALQLGLIYINDGSGNYTQSIGDTLNDAFTGDAEFADIDGDNDLDLLASGRYSGSILYKMMVMEYLQHIMTVH